MHGSQIYRNTVVRLLSFAHVHQWSHQPKFVLITIVPIVLKRIPHLHPMLLLGHCCLLLLQPLLLNTA